MFSPLTRELVKALFAVSILLVAPLPAPPLASLTVWPNLTPIDPTKHPRYQNRRVSLSVFAFM